MNDLVTQAEAFARQRHANLCRPNKAQQPCVEHLAEVAVLAMEAGCTPYGIAAAWLHDVVEDTDTTLEDIERLFGMEVAALVNGLTDPPEFAGLPLPERKQQQAERLREKDGEVLLIKLCDQISNVRSVASDPPVAWSTVKSLAYVKGAKQIADVCRGRSVLLDGLFEAAYTVAYQRYAQD